jgi:6-methylsalicylate decarboxylase
MASPNKIIDVHSHPILGFGQEAPMTAGHEQPKWSVETTLSHMDEFGITACVLSSPSSTNNATGQKARDIARRTNEFHAEIVSKYPKRFGAVATLPALDPDGALAEITYSLDTLKLEGVGTTTSHNDIYLGESQFDPWLEELNRRSTTLFAHPTTPKAGETLLIGLNDSILEFVFDTTRMIANMIATGAKKRLSQIKIITAHGGGTIPYVAHRLATIEHDFGLGPGRLALSYEDVMEGVASFYYDLTAATSDAQLSAMLKVVPTSQLMVGLDFPFMPKRTFAPTLGDIRRYPALSEADLRKISYENAFRLYPALAKRIG